MVAVPQSDAKQQWKTWEQYLKQSLTTHQLFVFVIIPDAAQNNGEGSEFNQLYYNIKKYLSCEMPVAS